MTTPGSTRWYGEWAPPRASDELHRIGSLLTPFFALQVDTRLAVAAVAVPHVLGTTLRFFLLKGGADRKVLWSFGLTSAAGGLGGAALQGWLANRWLTIVFGALLLFAAVTQINDGL